MMVILRPDMSEERVNNEVTKYKTFLQENGADEITVKVWGKRRLAYQIRRFNDGIYALFHFSGDGKQIALIERDLRLNDNIMRFLSLKLKPEKEEEAPDTEGIEEAA